MQGGLVGQIGILEPEDEPGVTLGNNRDSSTEDSNWSNFTGSTLASTVIIIDPATKGGDGIKVFHNLDD